jgi:hypothetical protein
VFDQLLDELQPSPDATMSDERGCCPCDFRLSIKIFSRMSINTIVIYRNGAVHNADIGRQGAAAFFGVIGSSALPPESAMTKGSCLPPT